MKDLRSEYKGSRGYGKFFITIAIHAFTIGALLTAAMLVRNPKMLPYSIYMVGKMQTAKDFIRFSAIAGVRLFTHPTPLYTN